METTTKNKNKTRKGLVLFTALNECIYTKTQMRKTRWRDQLPKPNSDNMLSSNRNTCSIGSYTLLP